MAATKLAKYIQKNADDTTCVIVASCPGSKMEAVEEVIIAFKKACVGERAGLKANLNLAYSQKEGANAWLGKNK